jgi:anhydro-N-acetylmuramic acid kinase
MQGLRERLNIPVDPADAYGWDGNALEAQCFGYLAARVQAGLPLSFPGTTGVSAPMRGGRVAYPGT